MFQKKLLITQQLVLLYWMGNCMYWPYQMHLIHKKPEGSNIIRHRSLTPLDFNTAVMCSIWLWTIVILICVLQVLLPNHKFTLSQQIEKEGKARKKEVNEILSLDFVYIYIYSEVNDLFNCFTLIFFFFWHTYVKSNLILILS